MRIGVVGFSAQKFDEKKAEEILREAFKGLLLGSVIVSGYTNLGIPAIAYRLAKELGAETMGIACAKAKDYECFPCDIVHIVGEEWGDESEAFLAAIDILIRVGGGKQSLKEVAKAKQLGIRVYEFDLEATDV